MSAGGSLFGTDGIRDVAGSGRLAPEQVHRIGRALARFAAQQVEGAPRIVLARDPRPSGAVLVETLAGCMADEGAEVVDAGVLPSPALAWLTATEGFALGCAVSASHNPAEYNGIKPFLTDGRKLDAQEEAEIEALAAEASGAAGSHAPTRDDGAAARYARQVVGVLAEGMSLRGLRLAVDLSAGAATGTAPQILEAMGVEARILNEAGERVINEDCGSEHPGALQAMLAAGGLHGGLAFDGDADRVLVVDETGELMDGDDLLAILAADAYARGGVPARTVVSTVMANLGLEEFLRTLDVRLERTPVGDRHVAARMRETGAVLGGEPAGHIVLPRDDAGGMLVGDGLWAGITVLQAARRLDRPLSELRGLRPRRPQRLVNVRMAERRPLDAWPRFQAAWQEQEQRLAGSGRFVIRYSGTEPVLRIMAEGRDEALVEEAVEALAQIAREA